MKEKLFNRKTVTLYDVATPALLLYLGLPILILMVLVAILISVTIKLIVKAINSNKQRDLDGSKDD